MPKINRVRIANIHYDGKIIKDLLINCYSGENVLLNLANGGGKSVLVQLMQQPLMPESKIHNREIYSYLSSDQPGYILIEWKLDNTPNNYFITGIVINKLFSSDDMNKTKYFTFVNEYKTANEFDIKNIPFIQKENNVIVYKSYETAMKIINESKTVPSLNLYNRTEQPAYRKKLAEYGIFVNEWKLLSKMNENEGGVDELFKNCKTSDRLIDDWILKTISDSNEAESRELKEMFASLMQEIIEQESNIKEKEILEDFKIKIEEYEETLKSLLKQLDEEKQVEIGINSIYIDLKNLSKNNLDKIEQILQKIEQGKNELNQINYEEISEEYYHRQNDLEAIKEEKTKKQEEVEKQKEKVQKAILKYRVQKVAYIVKNQKEAIAKIKALDIQRNNLEEQNGKDEEIIKIEYNLQEIYKTKVQDLNNQLARIEEENKRIGESIVKGKENIEINQKSVTEISTKIGILQEKIKQFEIYEKNLFAKMEIFIARNLLNELDQIEVQKIKSALQAQVQDIEDEIEMLEKQIKQEINEIEQLNKMEEENSQKIEELNNKYIQQDLKYKQFQEQETEIKTILDFHRIKESVFQKQVYFSIILEKQLEYKRKIEELISQIDRTKETILDLEQGGIHNSREIKKILENAHIEYITGEEYLKNQEDRYQIELLEKNPLLPYCYIVSEKDLERIKELDIKEESNKLAPIITYQNIDKSIIKDKTMIKIEEIYFLSLYHKECFSTNASEYKQMLENQLENYKKRKTENENQLHKIEEHMNKINQFNYEEKDKREMQEELVYLEREIQNKKEENITNRKRKAEIEVKKDNAKNEIQEKDRLLLNKKQMQEEFLKYLENNDSYCEGKKEKEDLEQQVNSKIIENKEIKTRIIEEEKTQIENMTKKNELTNSLTEISKKQVKIPIRETNQRLNSTLEELEAQYELLNKKYQQDKMQIDESLEFWNKRKVELDKEKDKDYEDIKESEYDLIIYSEEMEDLAKEESVQEEKELEYKQEQYTIIDKKYTRIETQYQTVCESLKKIGKSEPISANLIKGNYEIRKNEIKEEREKGESMQHEYQEENKKIQRQINDIERNVDINMITDKVSKERIEKAELQKLIDQYKEFKQKNQLARESIYKSHIEISNNYKQKHRIINAFLENVSINKVEEGNFEAYYYIYEKMRDCLEKLTEYIGILKLSLQNIEQDKKNILQHAIKQGKMLYQELKKISESSRIKIAERYVQILKIDIPQELKENVDNRIQDHINQCISELREECKNCENIKRTIESKIALQFADRALLNLTLDVKTIKVKLYKFDIENKNSGLRQWEDVIVGNSGGQRFIACFALISALIEYTRRKELESMGEDDKTETSKVFVLDNPFAKTSSKHLLEPMMEISKKFNIQMICLSDLSQSSITDKFDLIYQLALRSSKYTSNSFLNIEDVRVNSDVQIDTSLEKVYLRSNVEQMSFLN